MRVKSRELNYQGFAAQPAVKPETRVLAIPNLYRCQTPIKMDQGLQKALGAGASSYSIAHPPLSRVNKGQDPVCSGAFIRHVQFVDEFQKKAYVVNF
jgi:hypothetical protein